VVVGTTKAIAIATQNDAITRRYSSLAGAAPRRKRDLLNCDVACLRAERTVFEILKFFRSVPSLSCATLLLCEDPG